MSEFQPVVHKNELQNLSEDEMVAGYFAGINNDPEPGNAYSRSYWHGWRNGMADKGRLPIDSSMRNLAEEIVRAWETH